jgi:Flp pilus assembly protein TadG
MRRIMWWRRDEGAVIVEFALVTPLLFLLVLAVMGFSRAYTQLNALDTSLRESARYGATWPDYAKGSPSDSVKAVALRFAKDYDFALDTSKVLLNPGGFDGNRVVVSVTDYPIPLGSLGTFLGLPALRVNRSVIFRFQN